MQARLTIGDFSSLTHLSVKTLRKYHERGLLEPAEVDRWTAYRYYTADQIPTAQTIRRLRDLDMPVSEIADLLGEPEQARRDTLLDAHLSRLERRLEQTRESIAALRRLLGTDPEHLHVERRSTPARLVAAVSATVSLAQALDWYPVAMADLDATLAGLGCVPGGPAGALFDNELFTDDLGDLTVYLPFAGPPPELPASGRVHTRTLPPADVVIAVHRGSHADIDVTYGRLGRWVLDHDLTIAGPVHETYLVGPRDAADREAWRTEIGWPVRPTSPPPTPERLPLSPDPG